MIRFQLEDDEPDEDEDFDEDDENHDEDDEDDDEEDDDVETWQVRASAQIPLNVGLRLTSGIKLPRLARTFQLS